MDDYISRQAAINALEKEWNGMVVDVFNIIRDLPSAQPERLTDDDFETIRIHLNAYKEKLCNQHRWKEAEEYQRIIDRFIAFASAQPEIIRCRDCIHYEARQKKQPWKSSRKYCNRQVILCTEPNDFCSYGERKTDGSD